MPASATSLGYALLGRLHQQEQTGYALLKFFEDSPMGIYSSSPGAIYPALARLEKKGLLSSSLRDVGPVKRAKVYAPTVEGTEALREWLVQTPTKRDIEVGMDELMLRFAFHAMLDDPAATIAFLEALQERLDSYVEELEEVHTELREKGAGRHAMLALEGGVETYRAHARWARKAIAAFQPAARPS